MRLSVFFLFWVCLLAACGDGSGSGSGVNANLTYDFESNGCKTGSHTFNSEAAYCLGLQEDGRNKGCALFLRQREFQDRGCPGTFTRRP